MWNPLKKLRAELRNCQSYVNYLMEQNIPTQNRLSALEKMAEASDHEARIEKLEDVAHTDNLAHLLVLLSGARDLTDKISDIEDFYELLRSQVQELTAFRDDTMRILDNVTKLVKVDSEADKATMDYMNALQSRIVAVERRTTQSMDNWNRLFSAFLPKSAPGSN